MKTAARRREERLEVRLSKTAKRLLHFAATAHGKTVSAFVLDSSMTAAAETLADRQQFLIPAKTYEAFVAALDRRPTPKPRLDRLLKGPSVLE
jgi:uncharacterized protein (DUF1778 family)